MHAVAPFISRRTMFAVALLFLVMAVAYGFAAANVVDDSSAGDGIGLISGYRISDVSYTLAADPRNLASVSFTVADDGLATNGVATVPTTLRIGFPDTNSPSATVTSWHNCTPPAAMGGTATCAVTGVRVYDINFLQVVAAN